MMLLQEAGEKQSEERCAEMRGGMYGCFLKLSAQEIAPEGEEGEEDEQEEDEGARRLFSFAAKDPMDIVAQQEEEEEGAEQEDGLVGPKRGGKIARGESEHKTRDAAAGAVEPCDEVERAGQAEPRRATEDEVGEAEGEKCRIAGEDAPHARLPVGHRRKV